MNMKIVFLGIGTNLGDREGNISKAVEKIKENIGQVSASSSVYETEPWGFRADKDFLNLVLKVETKLTPSGLLKNIHMIESLLGRVRGEIQYESRAIDIDILLYEDMVIDEEILKTPHPLMYKRKFVLVPLCEIAPELVHPVLKRSIRCLLEECADKSRISKL